MSACSFCGSADGIDRVGRSPSWACRDVRECGKRVGSARARSRVWEAWRREVNSGRIQWSLEQLEAVENAIWPEREPSQPLVGCLPPMGG